MIRPTPKRTPTRPSELPETVPALPAKPLEHPDRGLLNQRVLPKGNPSLPKPAHTETKDPSAASDTSTSPETSLGRSRSRVTFRLAFVSVSVLIC